MELNTNDLIEYIARTRRFTKGDTKEFMDGLVEFLENCVAERHVLKVRGFGRLYYSPIPERRTSAYTDKFGVSHPELHLPPTTKVVFKLAENIRRLGQPEDGVDP